MSKKHKGLLCWLAVVLAVICLVGYKLYKSEQAKQYWDQANALTTYQGDGFKAVFPCSDIVTQTSLSDTDLNEKTSSCSNLGGKNHTEIDIYTVTVEHYLSNKYDPAHDVACASPKVWTGDPDTQTYFSEVRFVDGISIILCGKGRSSVYAKIQQGETVYTLTVLARVENTTSRKLDDFIRGFQLTN